MAYRPGKCLLHNILRERKLTPQEFANDSEFSKQELSDWANNRKRMSLGNAKSIAEELGIPIDDLYEWVERKRSRENKSRK